eukprot:gene3299-5740_t
MKVTSSLDETSLLKICEHFSIPYDKKINKKQLIQLLADFDEVSFFSKHGKVVTLEEAPMIPFEENSIVENDEILNIKSSFDGLNQILHSFNFKTEKKTEISFTAEYEDTRESGLMVFFAQDEKYYFLSGNTIFLLNFEKKITEKIDTLKIDETIQHKRVEICCKKNENLSVYVGNSVFEYNFKKKTQREFIIEHPIMKDPIEKLLKVKDIFIVKFIFNETYYYFLEDLGLKEIVMLHKNSCVCCGNDLIYFVGGEIIHGVPSNEILVWDPDEFDFIQKFYTKSSVLISSTFMTDDSLFLINSKLTGSMSKKVQNFRVKLEVKKSVLMSKLIESPKYSDFTIQLNDGKKFFLHKFILSKFTNLNMKKNEILTKMDELLFKKSIKYMYDGTINCSKDEAKIIEKEFGLKIGGLNEHYKVFSKILESKDHFDITLKGENISIQCHKLILSFESDYFKSLFESGFKESSSTEISIEEISDEHLNIIVQYFYSKNIDSNDPKEIGELLENSKFLLSSGLNDFLNQKLISMVNKNNVFYIFEYAFNQENEKLKDAVIEIMKNFYSIENVLDLMMTKSDSLFSNVDLVDQLIQETENPNKKRKFEK